MRPALMALAGASVLLCSCGAPRIEGVVLSGSGAPLAGVSVSLEGSGLVATTDSEGSYSLEAVDGTRSLRYSLEGFTTETVRLTLAPGTTVSSPEVILFPAPPGNANGALWVGPAGTTQLPRVALERRTVGSASSLSDEWVVAGAPDPASPPTVPAGAAQFVVRCPSEPILVRLDEAPGNGLVVSTAVSSWGIERERAEEVVSVRSVRAGEENLLVLSADLSPGVYLLRETIRKDPFPPEGASSGFLFRAGGLPGGKGVL